MEPRSSSTSSTSTSSPSSQPRAPFRRAVVSGIVEPSARFEIGAALDKGTCSYMEDAVVISGSINGNNSIDSVAVIDGHGHSLAKSFSMSFVQAVFRVEIEAALNSKRRMDRLFGIEKELKRKEVMKKAMVEAYNSIHSKGQTYFEGAKKTESPGGSCMASALLVERDLCVANAGDTFALLVSYSKEKNLWVGLPLSETHSCSNRSEFKRVRESGAEIQWVNGKTLEVLKEGQKVDEKRGDKGFLVGMSSEGKYRIQPTRSLLDYGFPGNISEPTTRHRSLTDEDICLILCSDGVSDNLSNQRIVQIVAKSWVEMKEAAEMSRVIVKAAVSEAQTGIDRDNTTALVVYLKDLDGSEIGDEVTIENWVEEKKEKPKGSTKTKSKTENEKQKGDRNEKSTPSSKSKKSKD